jgi:serine/threonine protein kinase
MHSMNIMHRDIKSANIFLVMPRPEAQSPITPASPKAKSSIGTTPRKADGKGELLYQAKLGDMNVSKVTR